jgi:hypothetical protein
MGGGFPLRRVQRGQIYRLGHGKKAKAGKKPRFAASALPYARNKFLFF